MRTGLRAAATVALLTVAACAAPALTPPAPPVPVPSAPVPPGVDTYEVAGAPHDGDTFRITTQLSGPSVPVRVLGIDAPEVPPAVPAPGDCYGLQARAKVQELLTGQTVSLQSDPEQGDKDRYGRLLRYVSTPDIPDLSLYLVEHGYARVYTSYPVARTPDYLRAQQVAQANKVGGWNVCQW